MEAQSYKLFKQEFIRTLEGKFQKYLEFNIDTQGLWTAYNSLNKRSNCFVLQRTGTMNIKLTFVRDKLTDAPNLNKPQ